MRRVTQTCSLLLLASVLSVLPVRSAWASSITLDQSFTGPLPPGAGGAVISGQTIAQQFEAGLAGLLSSVEVAVYKDPGTTGDVTLSVRESSAGLPGSVLFSTMFDPSILPDWSTSPDEPSDTLAFSAFDVTSGGILVSPGDLLFIELSRSGSFPAPLWALDGSSSYLPGLFLLSFDGGGSWNGTFGFDAYFQTYVDTDPSAASEVPEPATLVLLGTGLATAAARRRWRRTASKKPASA